MGRHVRGGPGLAGDHVSVMTTSVLITSVMTTYMSDDHISIDHISDNRVSEAAPGLAGGDGLDVDAGALGLDELLEEGEDLREGAGRRH